MKKDQQLEKRLAQLRQEFASGQNQLAELDQKRANLRDTLLRISGAIQVLRETLEEDDPRHEVMGEVLDQVQRLNNTVRDLLMFSKPWQPRPGAILSAM